MATHQLLARTIDDGDRVLFVGPSSRIMLHGIPRTAGSSQAASSELALLPVDETFDVVVLSGVVDEQSVEVIDVWAGRCHELLADRGRLVLHLRHPSLDVGWIGVDRDGGHLFADSNQTLDPRMTIQAFNKAGFHSRREIRHWATHQIAHVMVRRPGERRRALVDASSVDN